MSNPTLSHAYTDEEGSVHCNTRVYRGSVNGRKRLSEVSFSLFTVNGSIPFPMQSRLEEVEGIR